MSKLRPIITIGIILAVAASVSWWSARAQSRVSAYIQKEVTRLVPRFHADPTTIQNLVVDPIIEPILATSLEYVYGESIDHDGDFVVVITSGDDDEYGDGTATHVAMYQIDDTHIVSLRIICNSETEPLLIAGVFLGEKGDVLLRKNPNTVNSVLEAEASP